MRRILVINPNTSSRATERIQAILRPLASSATQLSYANGEAGAEGIDTLLDVAMAGIEVARIIVREREAYDAFIIACGADPGLDVARQITDKPVIGIAEAGILTACPLGATFSLLTGLRAEVPQVYDLVRRYGLSGRLASVVPVELSTAELGGPEDHLYQSNLAAARTAIDRDMAEVIVLAGSTVGGLAPRLREDLGVPVLSGIACALKLAESMLDMGLRTSHIYKYRTPTKQDRLIGYPEFEPVYSA